MANSLYELGFLTVATVIILIIIGTFIIQRIDEARLEIKKEIKEHQEWLFNQLYSMSPGKVLKPDEKDSVESKPAKILSFHKDPMREFDGKKDDWHS